VFSWESLSCLFFPHLCPPGQPQQRSHLRSTTIGHQEDHPLPALASNIHFFFLSLRSILNSTLNHPVGTFWISGYLGQSWACCPQMASDFFFALHPRGCPTSCIARLPCQWSSGWAWLVGKREEGRNWISTPLINQVAGGISTIVCLLCGPSSPGQPPP
jgi:hypothetical protein